MSSPDILFDRRIGLFYMAYIDTFLFCFFSAKQEAVASYSMNMALHDTISFSVLLLYYVHYYPFHTAAYHRWRSTAAGFLL